MRLSELAEATGRSTATLKFYLRSGVLHPGRSLSRTQADYDESHVARVKLVGALTEAGGLDLATVARVLQVVEDADTPRLELLATAQRALSSPESPATAPTGRARDWLERRGWQVDLTHPLVGQLERAWQACEEAGVAIDEAALAGYADAAESIAAVDLATVPDHPEDAARQVILGTVLVDPLLVTLRRLAQQHASITGDRSTATEGPALA